MTLHPSSPAFANDSDPINLLGKVCACGLKIPSTPRSHVLSFFVAVFAAINAYAGNADPLFPEHH